jgi:hypothetical protein
MRCPCFAIVSLQRSFKPSECSFDPGAFPLDLDAFSAADSNVKRVQPGFGCTLFSFEDLCEPVHFSHGL